MTAREIALKIIQCADQSKLLEHIHALDLVDLAEGYLAALKVVEAARDLWKNAYPTGNYMIAMGDALNDFDRI